MKKKNTFSDEQTTQIKRNGIPSVLLTFHIITYECEHFFPQNLLRSFSRYNLNDANKIINENIM